MRQGPTPAGIDIVPGMARAGRPRQLFLVLSDNPCPYLPGRRERKLITEIAGGDPNRLYSELSRAGFRRSHHFAYRPACTACRACVPIRVPVNRFAPSRSQKRVLQANATVEATELPAHATREQFALFARYIGSRHGAGEMAGMCFAEYRAMVECSRVETRVWEFRDRDGSLVGVCLIDQLDDGPSAVYSFFDPDLGGRSLGTFMILRLIEGTRARALAHVYLGYWIAESPKMSYKLRFRPLEALGANGWQSLPERQAAGDPG